MTPLIMAFTGKGGVGKTILSALAGKIFSGNGKRVLFVDADPAKGLAEALGVFDVKTIGQAREEIIQKEKEKKASGNNENLLNMIDYLLLEALYEAPDFSLLVMGRADNIGCYCPLNELLRGTIAVISSRYDIIIIDAEAGLEQVNRQVVESVHYPVIVSDNSMRGVRSAIMINNIIKEVPKMHPVKTGVLFNRVSDTDSDLVARLKDDEVKCYGSIKSDAFISEFDLSGRCLMEIPEDAPVISEFEKLLETILL